MELKAEVRMRNRHTGAETVLCTGISTDDALKWVNFSMQTLDPNDMPEYIIRPLISKTVRKAVENGNVAAAKQVQKP